MDRLFLDANIFIAATASETGGSRKLFELAQHSKCVLVSNIYALDEALKNVKKKLGPSKLPILFNFVATLSDVDKEVLKRSELQSLSRLLPWKDTPILLGALRLNVDTLITLDQKDFKTPKLQKAKLPFEILMPGEYLQRL